MHAALEEARARGFSEVELSSWAFNTEAHALFRSLGFEPRVVTFERRTPRA
jgi:ribosomal protein S18 acetylase RimI-like enzyme